MKKIIPILLLCLFASCRTIYVPVEKEKEVIKYEYINLRDTVYEKEQVEIKGDTVIQYLYKYKERVQYKEVKDTVTIQNDSIVYIPKEVKVVKYRQNGWGYLGWFLLVLGIVGLIYFRIKEISIFNK